MGARTAAAFKIDQNNTVTEYTRPEIAFDKLYGNKVTKPLSLGIKDERSQWSLSPDRQFIGTNVFVQVDGPYHRTPRQESKSRWEDAAYNANGFRVLHIDTELLMAQKYHAYVMAEVEKFLKSDEPTKRLCA